MAKPFLILQLRPETEAADDEFAAIVRKGGLDQANTRRIRLDQQNLPDDLSLDDLSGVIVGGGPGCVSDAPAEKSKVEARIEAQVLSLMPAITQHDFPVSWVLLRHRNTGKALERRCQQRPLFRAGWNRRLRLDGSRPRRSAAGWGATEV